MARTSEHVQQDLHPFAPAHSGTEAEAIAKRAAKDSHPRSNPQPMTVKLDHAVANLLDLLKEKDVAIVSKAERNKVFVALHPDKEPAPERKRQLTEAFQIVNRVLRAPD